MKNSFFLWFQCLFFLVFLTLSCKQIPEIIFKPVVHSSWQGGFILKYKTFAFGSLLSQNSNDPLFTDISLRKRIEKEFRFHFEPIGLSLNSVNPDLLIFTYFTGPKLPLPLSPYLIASPDLDDFQVSDSLKSDELFMVTDFVEPQNMFLMLRMVVKMQFKDQQLSLKELQAVIEAKAKLYPG